MHLETEGDHVTKAPSQSHLEQLMFSTYHSYVNYTVCISHHLLILSILETCQDQHLQNVI